MPNLILLVILYPFLFLLFHLMKYGANGPNNTFFGMTIPEHLQDSVELKQIEALYIKRISLCLAISGLLSVGIIGVKSSSISLTLLYLWLFLTIIITGVPYAKGAVALSLMMVLKNTKARLREAWLLW